MGVDFFQAVFAGASQVQAIGGPQVNRGWQGSVGFDNARDHGWGKWQPIESAGLGVSLELGHDFAKLFMIDCPLAKFAMEGGNGFSVAMQRASKGICGSQGADLLLQVIGVGQGAGGS
jgi:hypothetical protein